jgi:hypothetical protein
VAGAVGAAQPRRAPSAMDLASLFGGLQLCSAPRAPLLQRVEPDGELLPPEVLQHRSPDRAALPAERPGLPRERVSLEPLAPRGSKGRLRAQAERKEAVQKGFARSLDMINRAANGSLPGSQAGSPRSSAGPGSPLFRPALASPRDEVLAGGAGALRRSRHGGGEESSRAEQRRRERAERERQRGQAQHAVHGERSHHKSASPPDESAARRGGGASPQQSPSTPSRAQRRAGSAGRAGSDASPPHRGASAPGLWAEEEENPLTLSALSDSEAGARESESGESLESGESEPGDMLSLSSLSLSTASRSAASSLSAPPSSAGAEVRRDAGLGLARVNTSNLSPRHRPRPDELLARSPAAPARPAAPRPRAVLQGELELLVAACPGAVPLSLSCSCPYRFPYCSPGAVPLSLSCCRPYRFPYCSPGRWVSWPSLSVAEARGGKWQRSG